MDTLHRILDIMWKNGISEADLCSKAGINKSAVTDRKKGKTKSYYKHLPEIAEALGVTVNDLDDRISAPIISNIELAQRIKLLAKENDITLQELLKKCNINRNFIYDLEHKSSAPSSKFMFSLAKELNVSVNYLYGLTEQKDMPTAGDDEHIEKLKLLNSLLADLSDDQLDQVLEFLRESAKE